jgi:hypothetical protein
LSFPFLLTVDSVLEAYTVDGDHSRREGAMHDTLMKVLNRRIRRLAMGSTLGVMAATTAVLSSRVHDPNLDQADVAAEKAQILLGSAPCGAPGEKSTEACQRRVKRALDLLARVREIVTAATAGDGGEPLASTQP